MFICNILSTLMSYQIPYHNRILLNGSKHYVQHYINFFSQQIMFLFIFKFHIFFANIKNVHQVQTTQGRSKNVDLRTFSQYYENIYKLLIMVYKYSVNITLRIFCPNIYVTLKAMILFSVSWDTAP